ncbi:hypothetical protein ASPTUDRAFT_59565 [Aspergillus tubingensis CBS 134.48]|uniref:Uncharacterized protein n=1 Tax=Aspergillus tubingensis (strain CBS 134.48) TaxID=767770 RepID=A0A1L9MR14_ASPTC|nr:hypothetical protein ASPTUDRAFT_59565 [Aspergillus tubingensis CBS 134.48]
MDRLRGIAARFADPIIVRACIRGRSGPGLRNPSRQDGAEPADGRGPCLYTLQGPPPRGHCGIPAASAQHTIEAAVLTGECVERAAEQSPNAHTVTIGRPTAEWVGVEEGQVMLDARPWAAIGSPALTEECDSAGAHHEQAGKFK